MNQVTLGLREEAKRLGFEVFGIGHLNPSEHMEFFDRWLARKHHGEMEYLERPDTRERRAFPSSSFSGARSVIVVGHEYVGRAPTGAESSPTARLRADRISKIEDEGVPPHPKAEAVIARYARGSDYHHIIPPRLEKMLMWLDRQIEGGVRGRALVDTAPVFERELARRAGMGWFGRNTMLIHPRRGSFFVLGLLMVDVDLETTGPCIEDHCGTCHACIDECPTGALLGREESGAPAIDARRCISYLTIELKGPIPHQYRSAIGNRVFGCDICQEVCPWNKRFAQGDGDPAYRASSPPELLVDLAKEIFDMSEKEYQRRYRGSPLSRPRRKGMLRNLFVGIGNAIREGVLTSDQKAEAIRVLAAALNDPQPLVRGHAAWALGQAANKLETVTQRSTRDAIVTVEGVPPSSSETAETPSPLELLSRRREIETDVEVLEELRLAAH
ncbi:MAG: tRNA epoxyqueuosine(34) reductase QueG [Gemmatimonadetes bacterium]|nr:tRNA epoxyqueuosine(34) reductase QueG [Gemmatimonadota bacterium]|tara:strand:- start:16968 stop:18299 length:1332 start_codon:yes stop_codon:yes gene_type:complete